MVAKPTNSVSDSVCEPPVNCNSMSQEIWPNLVEIPEDVASTAQRSEREREREREREKEKGDSLILSPAPLPTPLAGLHANSFYFETASHSSATFEPWRPLYCAQQYSYF